ncbi:ATP-binding protein [Streptomyces violaceoruber]|uniref:Regulatory protein n=2 Tax=Streptomyces lividans TaxID=1916 RepID=A0ABN4DSC3_STRLI|nr:MULTISPECIES: ATP-binding protein [Streptomyces]QSJ09085.1 regulatory protein [Streptomyces lividans]AIJ13563.1 regulatory protein [Streptomyces lividans TK24]EFD66946.1 regulatory protein [Streptomyces lividans TK24]EOY50089.1 putative regulatory protein [Streptomyces lividans 1326]KKD13317.1 regulatory protein [Streptomyces sp. WM6391]
MGSSAGEVIGVKDGEGDCAEWVFPAAPDAVRTARSLVRRTLGEWRLDSVGDIAALLVSELVTNALRHATGPIGVRLVRGPAPAAGDAGGDGADGVLLVEVSDPLPDPPRERVARPDDEDGRGLQLVASAARRWGTRPGEAGKTVWFELALPR